MKNSQAFRLGDVNEARFRVKAVSTAYHLNLVSFRKKLPFLPHKKKMKETHNHEKKSHFCINVMYTIRLREHHTLLLLFPVKKQPFYDNINNLVNYLLCTLKSNIF